MAKTTLHELREKSYLLTGFLEYLIEHFLGPSSPYNRQSHITCVSITPKDPRQRGCQLSLKFNTSIDRIYKELVKRGVAVRIQFIKYVDQKYSKRCCSVMNDIRM
jgi:kynureninase